jgi:hypothetical protein
MAIKRLFLAILYKDQAFFFFSENELLAGKKLDVPIIIKAIVIIIDKKISGI